MNVYHEHVQLTAAVEHFIQCNAIGLDRHVLVNRASFAADVSSRVQFEQIGWNVRNSPKLSFAGGATNGNDSVAANEQIANDPHRRLALDENWRLIDRDGWIVLPGFAADAEELGIETSIGGSDVAAETIPGQRHAVPAADADTAIGGGESGDTGCSKLRAT